MKKIFPLVLLVFAQLACKKEAPEKTPEKAFYPLEITRTVTNSSDVEVVRYIYNDANQIAREDILLNNALQRSTHNTYSAEGRVTKNQAFTATGRLIEQNEISYKDGKLPEKIRHSYFDAAGNPQLHHSRIFEFYADGRLKRWTDLAPDNETMSSRNYTYNEYMVESIGVNGQGKFLDQIVQVYDGMQNPFKHTGNQVVTFAGNELKMELRSETGQVQDSYLIAYEYHEKGYPLKRTQTFNTGVIKTETYVYKTE